MAKKKESQKLALIVEDIKDLQAVFGEALQAAGVRSRAVGTVAAALEALTQVTPDVVLLDLRLPDGLGEQVLEVIREDPRLANVYVVVVTAYPDKATELDDRPDFVLVKPVGFKQLRDLTARLVAAIDRRQKAEEGEGQAADF